jgi:hypothetical protein
LLSVGRFGSGRGSVFGISLYSIGNLRGEAPLNSRLGRWGEGGCAPPRKCRGVWGDAVSGGFGICFGSVGFAVKPYMKPTLLEALIGEENADRSSRSDRSDRSDGGRPGRCMRCGSIPAIDRPDLSLSQDVGK